jgi:hypothetical protein
MRVRYSPCFASVPNDPEGRWRLIRQFVQQWYEIQITTPSPSSELLENTQALLGFHLPRSFRDYIQFADDLMRVNRFGILRDCFHVTYMPDLCATSLLMLLEGNVLWCVNDGNRHLVDPPVEVYVSDEKDNLNCAGTESPTITSFAVRHLASYLRGNGGGFQVGIDLSDEFVGEMRASFESSAEFDDIRVFESLNTIAFVMPSLQCSKSHEMIVRYFQPVQQSSIPNVLKSLAPTVSDRLLQGRSRRKRSVREDPQCQ